MYLFVFVRVAAPQIVGSISRACDHPAVHDARCGSRQAATETTMDRGSDGSGGSGEAVHGGDGGAYSTNGDLESPVLTKEKQGVQLSDEQRSIRSSDSPQSGKGIRLGAQIHLGFWCDLVGLLGV